jgi:hypothetical protein
MTTTPPITTYPLAEWRSLQQLRARYQQGHDLWSAHEWAYLCFLRCLVQTGRLVP